MWIIINNLKQKNGLVETLVVIFKIMCGRFVHPIRFYLNFFNILEKKCDFVVITLTKTVLETYLLNIALK